MITLWLLKRLKKKFKEINPLKLWIQFNDLKFGDASFNENLNFLDKDIFLLNINKIWINLLRIYSSNIKLTFTNAIFSIIFNSIEAQIKCKELEIQLEII